MKTIKEIHIKTDEYFSKRISGGMYSYLNIKPKEDKSQKGNAILNKLRYNYF